MKLKQSILIPNQTIQICGSKSISNRLLILNALFSNIKMENLSDSQDTRVLHMALESSDPVIDIHHAGTAMRFLTAYYSMQPGRQILLTGSKRMKERPIAPLVDALLELGANIVYTEMEGYPPLMITGKQIVKSNVSINADVSSQFITSLMLIGAKLPNGLNIELIGEITSRPYLEMTIHLLKNVGIDVTFINNTISIRPLKLDNKKSATFYFQVESDWSSASYFYSLAAISRQNINLKSFKQESYQGDQITKEIFWNNFGVNTITESQDYSINIIPESWIQPELIELDMNSCPDLAQTVAVTAAALKIPFHLTGLHTLKIKETDRILALHNELKKIGCNTEITDNSISSTEYYQPAEEIVIETYNDHRMALAFAPFVLLSDIEIVDDQVVEKSYPNFWKDLEKVTKLKKNNNE